MRKVVMNRSMACAWGLNQMEKSNIPFRIVYEPEEREGVSPDDVLLKISNVSFNKMNLGGVSIDGVFPDGTAAFFAIEEVEDWRTRKYQRVIAKVRSLVYDYDEDDEEFFEDEDYYIHDEEEDY